MIQHLGALSVTRTRQSVARGGQKLRCRSMPSAQRRICVPKAAVADASPVAAKQEAVRSGMLWFRVPPKIYFKGGCLEVALAELAGRKRALVVTDQTVYDMDLTEQVVRLLNKHDIQSQVFTHVPTEPTEGTIQAGLREIDDFHPDVIIAVGGGSPMDAAKLMWLLYEVPGTSLKQLMADANQGRSRMNSITAAMGTKALCFCVPTTSGTGAEVTPFAVIKDEHTGRKVTLANYALTPSVAVLDPQLVMQLPAKQTAYGGMLTLAHAMESYISVFGSDYTYAESKHAMSMMSRYYERAYRQGSMDYHAREKMHNAATVAGMAFANTFLGACHALASEVSVTAGCHLGLASGVLLPHVLAFMAEKHQGTREALANLSDHLHVGGRSTEERYVNVMGWVQSIKDAANIPATLKAALGEPACAALRDRQGAICAAALDNAHMLAAPAQPTTNDLRAILAAAGM